MDTHMWVPASLSGDVALVAQITAVLLESWVRGRSSILNALHSQESLLLELLSLKTLVSYSQRVFPQLGKKRGELSTKQHPGQGVFQTQKWQQKELEMNGAKTNKTEETKRSTPKNL